MKIKLLFYAGNSKTRRLRLKGYARNLVLDHGCTDVRWNIELVGSENLELEEVMKKFSEKETWNR